MESNVIICCDGKEMQEIMDKCYEVISQNGCEKCALYDAVCKKTGKAINFRIRRKDNVQSEEHL